MGVYNAGNFHPAQRVIIMKSHGLGTAGEVILRGARLFDGSEEVPPDRVDICVKNGLIEYILPAGGEKPGGRDNYEPEHSAREIDCSGLTLLPGLVDCHVHLALDGVDFEGSLGRWEREDDLRRQLAESLKNTLRSGVLAVRDGGDRCRIGLQAHRLAGGGPPPFICATGEALRKGGRYGSFLGRDLSGEVGAAVREAAAAGAAQIKVLVSGIVSFEEYGRVGPLQFSREELARLVAEAHGLGLKVMAHASSAQAAALSAECGVDSLEHGYFIEEDTLRRMAEQGTAWVPTLIPVACQLREPLRRNHSPSRLAVIERTLYRQLKAVETAHRLGVLLGVGTDAGASGVRHGLAYVEELKLMALAGISPVNVLRCATSNGARILGLEKMLGTAAPGRPAHLVGVRGDPLADLKALEKIDAIFSPRG